MQVVVLAGAARAQELRVPGIVHPDQVAFVHDFKEFTAHASATAFIDLHFVPDPDRIRSLRNLLPRTVVINSVPETLSETDASFIRINGWKTFLYAQTIEAAASPEKRKEADELLALFNKKCSWLDDIPGFVTPRVVSMIINEAYRALEEGVSTKEEINTAMKLGTNYPFGPFEWAEKIGLAEVVRLLRTLSARQGRYLPSSLLLKESGEEARR